ncbi:hypothetical protein GLYMA_18G174401v4 [Glycine max]|nr:hypothetical protein GLYMA_18G174401v4 [Glycine max]KAH1154913.1 hypothetical protein GYH30_050274 [Glycine max]
MDDDSTAHLVYHAYNLTKLDMEAWLHGKTKADSVGNVPCYLEEVMIHTRIMALMLFQVKEKFGLLPSSYCLVDATSQS